MIGQHLIYTVKIQQFREGRKILFLFMNICIRLGKHTSEINNVACFYIVDILPKAIIFKGMTSLLSQKCEPWHNYFIPQSSLWLFLIIAGTFRDLKTLHKNLHLN